VAVEPTSEKANWFALVEEEEEEEAREIAWMDPHIKRGARAWHEHLFRLPHKKESHRAPSSKQCKQSAQVLY
jgi:hypothetical protein